MPFGKNDSHVQNYFSDVPSYIIPEEGEDEMTPKLKEDYFEKIRFCKYGSVRVQDCQC